MNTYTMLADLVVVAHLAYVLFVVIGLAAILLGRLCRWEWVRNRWFRLVHLAMILVVVVESLLSITCPLTTLEIYLRQMGGQGIREGSFVGRLANQLLFYPLPPETFTIIYCTFGAAVVASLWLVPVQWRRSVAAKS